MTTSYKGYLIITDHMGRMRIEKEGHHITWVYTIDDARGIIDLIA